MRHGFPMGRLGTAEEVADVIVFLASPRAHWINGRHIAVDGWSNARAARSPALQRERGNGRPPAARLTHAPK